MYFFTYLVSYIESCDFWIAYMLAFYCHIDYKVCYHMQAMGFLITIDTHIVAMVGRKGAKKY